MPGQLFVQGRQLAAQGTPQKRTTLVQKGKLAYLQPVPRGMLFYPRSGCVFSFGLAGCLLFFPASSMTKPLAKARRSRAEARAGAVYRGLSHFAEAPSDHVEIRLAGTPAGRFTALP